ncbi:MAG: galactose-1-epimerase [Flavobacteriaceae bacterium]|nr:galactose-1-epimerase [Flavobacteriaceae bacterium]|tara:strand:- start:32770 stop:33930 length:1161 start_codon:yes stop_codon:yes gene_type:complete
MIINKNFVLIIISFFFLGNCKNPKNDNKMRKNKVSITKSFYGETKGNKKVDLYSFKNENGMQVDIINYGGIITSLKVPDKNGETENIVLGYSKLKDYINENPYFGSIIGRYGNRIAKGKFNLNGNQYTLATNNDENHLHGGNIGFDKVIWDAETKINSNSSSLILKYLSRDMEEGYPGNLYTTVTYKITNDNSVEIKYEAQTDKTTVINLTQHSYFNLSGDFNQSILNHKVKINANQFLPVNKSLIPTGNKLNVSMTPFDFRDYKEIKKDINADDLQLNYGNGYDHCWVLNDYKNGYRLVASAFHEESGRLMEVYSDQPGLQFYTGNFLDGSLPQKEEGFYNFRSGFCMETQHFPNSPNQPDFPSVTLNPNEKYNSKTTYKFKIKE